MAGESAEHDPSDSTGKTGLDAHDLIVGRTRRRIALFKQAGDDWRFAESRKNLSEGTAQEYEGRTLLELIQNGHDALRDGAPGTLSVLVDLESEQPAVYVANEGRPFGEDNFNAITELALSSKGPGEGIGNKGLGFRSVLQLTDWPEIYSKSSPTSPSFDGFCFRFAQPEDVSELVSDAEFAALVINQVSPLDLPIPAQPRGLVLEEFARAGFVSVIRLPLRNAAAADAATSQARRLASSNAPMLLFLERIAALNIEIRGAGPLRHSLTRVQAPSPLVAAHTDDWISEVDLGSEGTYLLARRLLPADDLNGAIEASIEAREVDARWRGSGRAGWVGLALRLDQPLTSGRLYTFLPMGAPAPLCAHAHAPFFTKLARLAISDGIKLNDYLLEQLAALALELGRRLRDEAPRDVVGGLVLDLVCWEPSQRINHACDGALGLEPVVPLVGERPWGSLHESFAWPKGDRPWTVLTESALAQVGALLLDPQVGAVRMQRTEKLHQALYRWTGMQPDEETAAVWVERVARRMQRRAGEEPDPRWGVFYDELEQKFRLSPGALQGRMVVLGNEGNLRAAHGKDPETGPTRKVFFAPEDGGQDAESRIPRNLRALQRRIDFTHPGIAWTATGRGFLERHQLVREYRTNSVLDALRDLLADGPSEALCRDALVFASRQFAALTPAQRSSLARIEFRVPTMSGRWASASRCLFSPDWGTDAAKRVERLIIEGGAAVESIAVLTERWIAPPESWPPPLSGDREAGHAFLTAIGVKDGLQPNEISTQRTPTYGRDLSPRLIARRNDLGATLADQWSSDVAAQWNGGSHPNTLYDFAEPPVALRGADQLESLGPDVRRQTAELILIALRTWPDTYFAVNVLRPNRDSKFQDPHSWPTPLASFLRHHAWLPVQDGRSDSPLFVRPGQAWHASDGTVPHFLLHVPRSLRPLVNDAKVMRRLRNLGLRVWGTREHSREAVRDLSEALDAGNVDDHQVVSFKKHYAAAWTQVADAHLWPWTEQEPVRLAVECGTALTTITASSSQEVYIVDEAAEVKESLVALAGHPVLVAEPAAGPRIADLLEAHDVVFTRLSRAEVTVLEGESKISASDAHPLLIGEWPWLALVVALVAELRPDPSIRRGDRSGRLLAERVRSIRLARASEVEILVDGVKTHPSNALRALPMLDEPHPTIVVWGEVEGWSELQACASALAHLLRRPTLRDPLELTFLKLQNCLNGRQAESISDNELAQALDSVETKITELRRSFIGALPDLLHLLRPILLYAYGPRHTADVDEALAEVSTEAELAAAIDRLASTQPFGTTALIDLARQCATPADMRDALDLDFARFNEALVALGAPYSPTVHPKLHDHVFNEYLTENTHRILDRLRERFQPDAAQGLDVPEYVRLRHFDGLVPDPAWLLRYRIPPVEVLVEHVLAWLRSHGASDDLDRPPILEPLETLRTDNRKALDSVVDQTVPLLRAWSRSRGVEVPERWSAAPRSEARAALDDTGLADLILLDEPKLLNVLAEALGWPSGMARTLDAAVLGLKGADLQEPAPSSTDSRDVRRDRSTISIGDSAVRVGRDHLIDVAEAARASIDDGFLSLKADVQLSPALPARTIRPSGTRADGFAMVSNSSMSEDQRSAVGLTGEILARAWLQRRYPAGVDWRSGYAAALECEPEASDGLGYDFEVTWRRSKLFFEVKAHAYMSRGTFEFELGESEVLAAQQHARSHRYRILLITGVLDPENRQVFELPNPFDSKGIGRYRVLGRGLRYQCVPNDTAQILS